MQRFIVIEHNGQPGIMDLQRNYANIFRQPIMDDDWRIAANVAAELNAKPRNANQFPWTPAPPALAFMLACERARHSAEVNT